MDTDVYDDGTLRVEHANYYVTCSGRPLKLTRKEFLLLSRLTRNVDRVITSEELWSHAWGTGHNLNSESLHVHIYRLRRLLKSFGLHIETMVNVGYRLVPVKRRML